MSAYAENVLNSEENVVHSQITRERNVGLKQEGRTGEARTPTRCWIEVTSWNFPSAYASDVID